MPIAIQTRGLSRVYKSYRKPEGLWNSVRGLWDRQHVERVAVEPTDLSLEGGQIVGLVGANGAGKTTLLKMLSGLIAPSAGEARVLGHDPSRRESAFLRKISILLGQKNQLWWDIAPLDSFAMLARIYDLDPPRARERAVALARRLQCEHVLETQLRRLSLGERMKMEIIGALLHEPEVLFLDEPTIGLDIVAQETIRDFLEEYVRSRGPTVILTSHYMDDIARLARTLLLISKGRIVYQGGVDDFVRKADQLQSLYLRYVDEFATPVTLAAGHVLAAGTKEHHLKVNSRDLGAVMGEAARLGVLQDLKLEETDFEDVIKGFLETESRVL